MFRTGDPRKIDQFPVSLYVKPFALHYKRLGGAVAYKAVYECRRHYIPLYAAFYIIINTLIGTAVALFTDFYIGNLST